MKIRLSTIAVIGALSAMNGAHAADIIEPAPAYEPTYEPVSTSGWYLRGDVGYVFKSRTSGDYSFYNQFPGVEGVDDVFHYDRLETKGTASFGAGVGYRFTDHVRTDVTLDYFKTDIRGTSSCISYVTASMGLDFYNDCHYEDTSKATVWTALANAYIDIAKVGSVTPYIGAGLGFSHVKYDDMRNEQVCGSDPACDKIENYVGYHEGEASVRFSAALTAGASVDITDQLKFDANYRYLRIAEGDAFGYDEADRSFGAEGVQGRDHGFDIHTVRAGLRYEFGGYAGNEDVSYAAAPSEPFPTDVEPVYK